MQNFANLNITTSGSLEVIIKITERCNINCTYCYMFNRGNEDYLARPANIADKTIDDIARFLAEGAADLGARRVNVVFHGGEPLMLKKSRFDRLCQTIRSAVEPLAKLRLSIQTNAMLIDDEWIRILAEHRVDIGISLDGPAHIHDRARVDKRGKGTYARTLNGIQALQRAFNDGLITKPGVICVIDPETSAAEIYRHLVSELQFTNLSFNLPMETVDSIPADAGPLYSRYLTELFDVWAADDNPRIHIRLLDQMLRFFAGDRSIQETLPNYIRDHVMVVISSDGELSEHDDFKVINFAQRGGNVRDTKLVEFANSPLRGFLDHLVHTAPDDCRSCDWWRYCRGGISHGLTVSRYSSQAGFNNRSSMCEGFTALFEAGAGYLLRHGLPVEALRNSLSMSMDRTVTAEPVQAVPAELFS